MDYTVDPGLYALGSPDKDSPVLVSANYKLSFDSLRSSVASIDAWVLVLDTNGINVWCAAGKGTFGTQELADRIESSRLSEIVSHRRVILPQLSGPGVAGHQVKRLSGFKAVFGPIRATDIPAFVDAGLEATPAMRRKAFPMRERTVLIPVELVDAIKASAILLPIFFVIGGLGGSEGFWTNAMNHGLFAVIAVLSAILAGSIVTPILLPWLPGRAFALKGVFPGIVAALILIYFRADALSSFQGRLELLGWLLMIPALSAHLAMNFTGASTYTSLSGVRKEMRVAVPAQIGAAAIGLVLWLGSRFYA